MTNRFWTKDPTRLPCPNCGCPVDAGATLKSMRLLAGHKLTCPHCGVRLNKKSTNYWPIAPVLLANVVTHTVTLAAPWDWIVLLIGLSLSFWLAGKTIQSTRLVIREPD